jgi:PAS domain S-box-containing protein
MQNSKSGNDTLRRKSEERLRSQTDLPGEISYENAKELIHELRVHQIELEMQNDELRRSQVLLDESRMRYADLYDFAPVGYLTFDRTGLIVEANLTAAKQLGRERTRILDAPFFLYVLDRDRSAFHLHLAKVFKTGERQTCEVRLAPGNGEEFYARLDSIFIEDASGQDLARTSISDISSSKRAEDELREREEQLRLFAEHAPAAIAMLDSNMRYVAVSRRWLSDYGLIGRQLVGRSHYDVFPEIPERWKEIHRRCLAGAVERAEEDPFVRADGSTQWIAWEIRPWYGPSDAVGGIIIFSEDITERKGIEEALRRANNELDLSVHALREKTENMEEINAALRVLLRQREEDRKELVESVLANVRNLILPYMEKLNQSHLDSAQTTWVKILESHLNEITSSFGATLAAQYANLTSTEIRIAALIRDARSTAQIAGLFGISEKTVCRHRDNIRNKLGLRGGGANLRTHLLSLK